MEFLVIAVLFGLSILTNGLLVGFIVWMQNKVEPAEIDEVNPVEVLSTTTEKAVGFYRR